MTSSAMIFVCLVKYRALFHGSVLI